jgi:glucose/arabinose dehydrogenase
VTKITGLPKVDSRGQGGLLDIVIDPDFENNQTIYWTFSEPYEKGNLTSVGKGLLSGNKIVNPIVIFRATPSYDGRFYQADWHLTNPGIFL